MRQSEQLCERVLPRTNVPSTVQLSKGPASQDIVPLTKNMLPKKHHRGVHGPPSDFNSDGDGDVFPSAVGLPHSFDHRRGPIPFRWHQHARVEPGAPSARTNQARG